MCLSLSNGLERYGGCPLGTRNGGEVKSGDIRIARVDTLDCREFLQKSVTELPGSLEASHPLERQVKGHVGVFGAVKPIELK